MCHLNLLHVACCTANELGWSDLTEACDGIHHTQCPVEAIRIYNHRWDTFRKTYLAPGPSPLGDITRLWWRHEDQVHLLLWSLHKHVLTSKKIVAWQARGSLHIHAALWIDPATIKEDAIVGTAPRKAACTTRAQRAWRKFVLRVQR